MPIIALVGSHNQVLSLSVNHNVRIAMYSYG
jgi:hypothetical protein